jgi:hypothetical protein
MAITLNEQVPLFTPVWSHEHSWIDIPTSYLSPFAGRQMAVVLIPVIKREDGSTGVILGESKIPCFATAIIVASYILSLGVLPLLAAIATAIIRSHHKFHWVATPPLLDEFANAAAQYWRVSEQPAVAG